MKTLQVRRLSVSVAATLAAGLAAGCGGGAALKVEPSNLLPPTVVVADVEQRTVPIYGEFVGQTRAQVTVELRARVEGVLEKIHFREGQPVRKGALLFSIDRQPFQAVLQSAQATLAKSEADLAQSRQRTDVLQAQAELAKEKAVTELELDAAVAARKSAQAGVDAKQANLANLEASVKYTIARATAEVSAAKSRITQAQLDLGYCDIYSPINGIIGFKNVDVGNLVGRGEATLLATVSSSDPLLVNFNLSEIEFLNLTSPETIGKQKINRRIELILSDESRHPYEGALQVVDRTVDPQTGTMKVEVSFPNPRSYLRPGQFARLRAVVAERKDAVLVPQRAVQEMQGARTVMVVDGQNKVSVRTVSVGDKSDTYFVVLQGLNPGERVIVEGMQKVKPGAEVNTAGESARQSEGS
jgi:membrane fusion protein, multidrug efflux system